MVNFFFNFGFHSYCMISIPYHNASSVNTTVKSCGNKCVVELCSKRISKI